MKLLLSLVRKDFKRNRVITLALTVFLILSALLMAGGLSITGTMMSSLNGLNALAVPPDYLQMHKGDVDERAFEAFVRDHSYIDEALIVRMLGISNAKIIYQGETLEKYLMDNGFVVQNEPFDHLLNLSNDIARVEVGEIGVPVYYAEELGIAVGDTLTVLDGAYRKELTVSTLIRDASMNAALTSSKRFLVNSADLDDLSRHVGQWEYCFEFLLAKDVSTATLEQDYIKAGLPANGVAVTGQLLRLLNDFSHGLIAMIIIAISILLILIAMLCLSYIIRATLADEQSTIGEMKAIGLSGRSIERLYQMKYIVLVVIASVIGYLGAIPFGQFFSASIVLYCGQGTSGWMKWIFPLLGIILLSVIVLLGCRRILRRNLRRSVVELLCGEATGKKEVRYTLPKAGLKHRNLTIALGELRCKWKEYIVLFVVFMCSSFLILLPMNLKSTVENPSFMTYMGVAESDIRIDIQYNDQLMAQKDAVVTVLKQDPDIARFSVSRTGSVQLQQATGERETIRVEQSDDSGFVLKYLDGQAPVGQSELALSYLNATELDKQVGDPLSVYYQDQEISMIVSGIYQDITYGGKTAKANIDFDARDVEVYILYLDVSDGVSIEEKAAALRNLLPDVKVTPISEFVAQTLGGITDNLNLVASAAAGISLLLILLITTMMLQLIIAREHSAIAVKKAIGFSNRDIRVQLGIRILIIQVVAIIVGTYLANELGEVLLGLMMSSMGASKIVLLVNPVSAYLVSPILQLLTVFITVIIGTRVVRNDHIRNQIRE